jgi:hypothetical protein
VTVIGIPLWLRVMIPNIIIFNLLPQSDRLLACHQHDPPHRPAADAIDAGEQLGPPCPAAAAVVPPPAAWAAGRGRRTASGDLAGSGRPLGLFLGRGGDLALHPLEHRVGAIAATLVLLRRHPRRVFAWINLNRDALLAHWRGDIDGIEMGQRTKRLPCTPFDALLRDHRVHVGQGHCQALVESGNFTTAGFARDAEKLIH